IDKKKFKRTTIEKGEKGLMNRQFSREIFLDFQREHKRQIRREKEKLFLNKKRLVQQKEELKRLKRFNEVSIYKNYSYLKKQERKLEQIIDDLRELQWKLRFLGEIKYQGYKYDSLTIKDLKRDLKW